MEAGEWGHCENSITVLLCQAVLVLFVNLNCPNILCHLQHEVVRVWSKVKFVFESWRLEDVSQSQDKMSEVVVHFFLPFSLLIFYFSNSVFINFFHVA